MVQRRVSKSCCGKSSIVFTVSKPARKNHIQLFKDAGFSVPENYIKCGLLYAKKEGLIATCTFGICTVNVRCSGANCETLVNQLEQIFNKIESEP